MDAAQRPLYPVSPFTPRATVRPFRAVAGAVVTVADSDLNRAASCVARQFEVQRETLRFHAWITGALPVLYGVATWVFGTSLWASSPVYTHALAVPGAPQSWGTVFIVLGVASIVAFERRQHRASAIVDMLTSLVLACFMAAFVLAGFKLHLPMAASHAISYGLFALLYMNTARLSWKSRDRR